eukprot:1946489-Pyramimonas_sp.AAC.1
MAFLGLDTEAPDEVPGGDAVAESELKGAFEDALKRDEVAIDELHRDAMDFLGTDNPPPEKGM